MPTLQTWVMLGWQKGQKLGIWVIFGGAVMMAYLNQAIFTYEGPQKVNFRIIILWNCYQCTLYLLWIFLDIPNTNILASMGPLTITLIKTPHGSCSNSNERHSQAPKQVPQAHFLSQSCRNNIQSIVYFLAIFYSTFKKLPCQRLPHTYLNTFSPYDNFYITTYRPFQVGALLRI